MTAAPPEAGPPAAPATDGAGAARAVALRDATERSFSKRTVVWLAIAGAVSLLATLLIPVFSSDQGPGRVTVDPNAYSRSALGHHAFAEFLRDAGLPVLVSRSRSAAKAGPNKPLLIMEPSHFDEGRLQSMATEALERGAPVVIVLPKWEGRGAGTREHPKWVRKVDLLPADEVADVLADADRAAQRYLDDAVSDEALDATWVGRAKASAATEWEAGFSVGGGPTLDPVQTIDAGRLDLQPILTASGGEVRGALIARWRDTNLYVLTDPDLVATAGLGEGDNAIVAYRFLTEELDAEGVIIDEILHGFPPKSDSIWRELFSFPLSLLTVHLLGLLLLVLWASLARYGKPAEPPPRVPPGKQTLIDNTATLLSLGGHVGHSLREYFRATVRAVAHAQALSPTLSDTERLETLARLGQQRHVSVELLDLHHKVEALRGASREARKVVHLARQIYRFRVEMTDGHRGG